jgi:hypothetical protein
MGAVHLGGCGTPDHSGPSVHGSAAEILLNEGVHQVSNIGHPLRIGQPRLCGGAMGGSRQS